VQHEFVRVLRLYAERRESRRRKVLDVHRNVSFRQACVKAAGPSSHVE
jgi:hypothetical protein